MIAIPRPIHVVYLAGAVDRSPDPNGWRKAMAALLRGAGIVCFSPPGAFPHVGPHLFESSNQVMAINQEALRRADVMVANLGESSVGTGREIQIASEWGIPVVAIVPYAPTHALYDVHVVKDEAEAIGLLLRD